VGYNTFGICRYYRYLPIETSFTSSHTLHRNRVLNNLLKGWCVGCDGFESRTRKFFEKDGYIVKVLGKRKTAFGTAWYQLNHSTIRTNVKRPHACTWFGVCSYRKLKVKVEKRKSLCPICGEELVKLHYLGVRRIVKERDSPEYVGSFVDDLVDSDGSLNWVEAHSGSYG
jgi:hypothetical protein